RRKPASIARAAGSKVRRGKLQLCSRADQVIHSGIQLVPRVGHLALPEEQGALLFCVKTFQGPRIASFIRIDDLLREQAHTLRHWGLFRGQSGSPDRPPGSDCYDHHRGGCGFLAEFHCEPQSPAAFSTAGSPTPGATRRTTLMPLGLALHVNATATANDTAEMTKLVPKPPVTSRRWPPMLAPMPAPTSPPSVRQPRMAPNRGP